MADIRLEKIESFYVGGHKVSLQGLACYEAAMTTDGAKRTVDPNGDFWTGQMYAQHFKLTNPKAKYPLMLWHGGGLTASCWETTPDGREGWQTWFLRQGHDLYLSDAVERGRASWSRYPEIYPQEPVFRTFAHAWESFRIGPTYNNETDKRETFAGSQYPGQAFETSMMAAVPRWACNNDITQQAYDDYVAKVGEVVILAHSQACSFAVHTALRHPQLVKGLILIEPSAMPDYHVYDLTALKEIPQLFLWGDLLDVHPQWNKNDPNQDSYYKNVANYYAQLKQVCNNTTWLELPELGIFGNSHMLMHDFNSIDIAAVIQKWIAIQGLMK